MSIQRLAEPDELAAWETAWRGDDLAEAVENAERIFLPGLLETDDIAIIAGYRDDTIVAGSIASDSGEVIGLSNLFLSQPSMDLRAGCAAKAVSLHPGLPLVGYESGPDLAAMLALGFETVGPLRIWIRSDG